MESAKSKQSGSCPRIIYSPVVLGDFSGKSRRTGPDKEVYQTSMGVMHDGLEKFKALEAGSGEGTAMEMLSSLEVGEVNTKGTLSFGELVWGKVRSYPWWPGQIYDENLATSQIRNTKRKGSVLVAFFGDCSYAWLDHDEIIPFEPHFEEKLTKTKSWNYPVAVQEAVDELKRRAALGLTCFCQQPCNFLPSRIEGLYKVDVSGYEPGAIYSSKQIKISRDGFEPRGIISFVKRLAKSPRSMQSVDRIINCAKVTAYRNAIFNENDEPYDEAFEEFEKDEETCDQAFGVKASNSFNPVEFPEEGNELEGTTSAQAIAEAPNAPSSLAMSGEIADLEWNDSITLETPCTDIALDKIGPATLNYEHKGTALEVSKAVDNSKSFQALDEPIMVKEERLQNVKFPTLLFDASVPETEESSFKDRGDYSNDSCRKEIKRKRMEESPPNDQVRTEKFRTDAIFDKLVAKSAEETERIYCSKGREVGKKKKNNGVNDYAASEIDGLLSDLLAFACDPSYEPEPGNSTGALKLLNQFRSTFYHNSWPDKHEKKNKKRALLEGKEEHMTRKEELRGLKSLCMTKNSSDQKLLTPQEGDKTDIQVTLPMQSDKKFPKEISRKDEPHLSCFDCSKKEFMGEMFDKIQSFEGEPHDMSFQKLPFQSNVDIMKSLPEETSKCRADAEKQAFPKSNTNRKSIACDNQEVEIYSSIKVDIGCENSQEVFSEILCASSSACSSIQYKQKVGTLDATVAAINRKYSMDEGWKSLYQQNLTAINGSDISHQLTNLLQKCNELLSGTEASQDQFSNQS